MRNRLTLAATAALLGGLLGPASLLAQMKPSIVSDLLADVTAAKQKIIGLAQAIPESKYDWRPGEGVRSVGEVFKHVTADNYLIPMIGGVKAPAESGFTDFNSAGAYESKKMSRDQIIADLEKSFAHIETNLSAVSDAKLKEKVDIFGTPGTVQGLWVLATTHLHEHLGQMIAYARSNGVVPPWSR